MSDYVKLGDQLNPLRVGDYIQLNEYVSFGPIMVLRVTAIYRDGTFRAFARDHIGRETEVWDIHWRFATRCESDIPPSRAWIDKLCGVES